MNCQKCDTKNQRHAKFCKSCGHSLHNLDSQETNGSHKGFWAFVIILLLISLTLLFVPTRSVPYVIQVPYESTEPYTVSEPYTTQEPYQKQVAYQTTETYYDQVPVQKTHTYDAPSGQYYPSCNNNCQCTSKNWWGNCIQCTCQYTEYQTITKERPVTKYNTVTAYREIVQYQDVQKTRQVTKLRWETKYNEMNWLLDFKVPWKIHAPYLNPCRASECAIA